MMSKINECLILEMDEGFVCMEDRKPEFNGLYI